MVVTAVLKAVSLSGGHTVAMELPTSMGIKQSSSLMLAMYVCMYVCMYVTKDITWNALQKRIGTNQWVTKGLKKIGTNQRVATSQLGGTHIHAMYAGGRFGTSVE